jgi:hypothetical protein
MSHEQSEDDTPSEAVPPALFQYAFSMTGVVGVGVAGYFMLENPAVAAVAAVLVGVGEYFTLGYMFEEKAAGDDDATTAAAGDSTGGFGDDAATGVDGSDADDARFVHPLAVGFGASAAGTGMFALYLATEALPMAVGGGLAAGLAVYLVMSILMSR